MASLTITLEDDSAELAELMKMVDEAQQTNPGITPAEYVSNLISGYAKNRIVNNYKALVNAMTLSELQEKLGPLK